MLTSIYNTMQTNAVIKAPSVNPPSFKNRVKLNITTVYVCEDCCCSLFIEMNQQKNPFFQDPVSLLHQIKIYK